jgi:hypothetical protein
MAISSIGYSTLGACVFMRLLNYIYSLNKSEFRIWWKIPFFEGKG